VFPIWDKILKPRFQVSKEKTWENLFFAGFETNVILRDKNMVSF